jgi:hypothetical protein
VVQTETVEQPKSGFNALLEQIKARRDDSNVIGSPNVQQPEIKVDSASSSMDHYLIYLKILNLKEKSMVLLL